MTKDLKLLLEPSCPPPTDPQVLKILRTLGEAAGSAWVVVEVQRRGLRSPCRFVFGDPVAGGQEIEITSERGFHARLEIDAEAKPSPTFPELAKVLLEQELYIAKLRRQAILLQGALDTTAAAVLLFDSAANIVYANPPAEGLLARQTEKELGVVERGRQPVPLFAALCGCVEEMVGQEDDPPVHNELMTLSDGSVLACEVMRVLDDADRDPGVVILLQSVAAAPEIRLGFVASTFDLSPREREVLDLLARGMTTAAVADHMCISQHTVRDHIKSLYRKTGTCSRSGLLSLLSNGGIGSRTESASG